MSVNFNQDLKIESESLMSKIKLFLSFDKLVILSILKFFYIFVALLITVVGICLCFFLLFTSKAYTVMLALLITIVINISWRLTIEMMIIIYKIHEKLVSIDHTVSDTHYKILYKVYEKLSSIEKELKKES